MTADQWPRRRVVDHVAVPLKPGGEVTIKRAELECGHRVNRRTLPVVGETVPCWPCSRIGGAEVTAPVADPVGGAA